ncbi:hypothetical protein [Candidatus Poriferisodalis sp.]|uniref:hypothetical protein n=1 Tax=Candidatus Poriferisodalis sp. TaxID=3101277 RepID=UPI003B5C852F
MDGLVSAVSKTRFATYRQSTDSDKGALQLYTIAHHEPIFQRNLKDDYRRIRDVVGLLSEPALMWLDHHSSAPDALDVDPDAVLGF